MDRLMIFMALCWQIYSTPIAPPTRARGVMVALPPALVLFSGDTTDAGLTPDTWTFTTAHGWVRQWVTTPPPARADAGFAVDTLRHRAVLFGGEAGQQLLNDTWVWRGYWVSQTTTSAPTPRVAPALFWDGTAIILFGGYDGQISLNDTWRWDGSAWQQLAPPQVPPGRSGAATAYLPGYGAVLFGGYASRPLGDTWQWDGNTWHNLDLQVSPPARSAATLTYITELAGAVLFGGYAPAELGDTWLFQAGAWTPLVTPQSPPARFRHMAAALDGQLYVFGGQDRQGVQFGDTWELQQREIALVWQFFLPLVYHH